MTLREQINLIIKQTLERNSGNLAQTARVLGVSLRMIRYKVREFERSGVTLPPPQTIIDERPEGEGESKGIA